ncbi:c-type cytochrome [Cohnella rhizosphaerae]|uniref:Cytochrome c n=1 Tax=Cohnella rhizosphaerae TaxID=1457232 RepID=A0A9X4KQX9_9BACL|nr:cytochrome c [Cohnella rhizosphaerae]MDG0809556.1 cytochrome c [Cohnella rhizosphaerae]
MRKWAAIAATAALLAMTTAACGKSNNNASTTPPSSEAPASPGGTTTASGEDAETIYKAQCIACHAADLSGGVGPKLTDVGARLSTDELSTRIHNGGGGMPAFKGTLTDDQINTLVNWLSTKKG